MIRADRKLRPFFPLAWTVGPADGLDDVPAQTVLAQVPGAVQLDWARAMGWPLPEDATNIDAYQGMEDKYWSYQTLLPGIRLKRPKDRVFFVAKGIDYRFLFRVDGKTLLEQEGMFTPVEIDITDHIQAGVPLEVRVFPAPKAQAEPNDRSQARKSAKPAVSYGWDFHPRLIPLGIFAEAGLEIRPETHITNAHIGYKLYAERTLAQILVQATIAGGGRGTARWVLRDPDGQPVIEGEGLYDDGQVWIEAVLTHPRLWWPRGQGDQPLYTSELTLLDPALEPVDRDERRIGFRTVRLLSTDQHWFGDDPDVSRIPGGPRKPPITLEVNGRPVFAKGANWVSPDIFPGRVDDSLYGSLLEMAVDANFNMVRCWGGAPVPKDGFFDLCDELGLMVWQEFPLACNEYPDEPSYLSVLDRESKSIISRLQHHASLVLWCGGNELYNPWSLMTPQHLAIRLLNRNCFDLDPQRPFLETSPLFGMGHGWYTFVGPDGREVIEMFRDSRCTAYTEFGVAGPAPKAQFKALLPSIEAWPPEQGGVWTLRKAFGAWEGSPTSWLELPTLERYFGRLQSVDAAVEAGELMQSTGLKFIYEEARRQKPYCSMALCWCFNEPWPCLANCSLVHWPDVAKPALAAVAESLKPVVPSVRFQRFSYPPGTDFTAELWLLNDCPERICPRTVVAHLENGGRSVELGRWQTPELEGNQNAAGPILTQTIPADWKGLFDVVLEVEGHPEEGNRITLSTRPPAPVRGPR